MRLVLVDDHVLFRESLRRLLEGDSRLRVVGDFSSAEPLMEALHDGLEFDVALLDYELSRDGGGNGLELVGRIRRHKPQARILMVTAGMETPDLVRAVMEHDAGVFLKTEPTEELLLAIERTAGGERWISSRAALTLLAKHEPATAPGAAPAALSARESRVLRGVLEGKTNKEIGASLELTESSVKAVLQKLFEKTGVRSRSQLVRYAIEAQIETR